MPSVRSLPFTILHNQPRRRPCPENLEIGSCPRYIFPTHKSPTASKWPGGSNLGAQSTIALLLSALPTPFPYPGFLRLAQARFLIILSTAIAACAPGLSLKALILSAMEKAPRLILAVAFTNKEEPPSSGLPLRAPPSLGPSLWALPSPSVPLRAAYTSQSGSSSILAARPPYT